MMEHIFYVPLYHYKVNEWEHKKNKLIQLYQSVLNECNDSDNKNLITNYHTESYNTAEGIYEVFYDEIEKFLQESDIKECKIQYAWFEKSNKKGYHGLHNHGSTGYSSVCFIDYDKNEHKPTIFLSPFNNFLTGTPLIHIPTDIVESSIIFFPSSIIHYTDPNVSNKDRLIVSFNLTIE